MADDPRIAAFARANRRRNALAFAVLGLALLIGGGIATVVIAMQPSEDLANENGLHPGNGYQLLVMCAGAALIGIFVLVAAYRVWRGQLVDIDGTTPIEDIVVPVEAPDD